MATLTDGNSTTSPGKKSGVRIKGIQGATYQGSVSIKKGDNYLDPVNPTAETDIRRETAGKKNMSITNNTGATIEYFWID